MFVQKALTGDMEAVTLGRDLAVLSLEVVQSLQRLVDFGEKIFGVLPVFLQLANVIPVGKRGPSLNA